MKNVLKNLKSDQVLLGLIVVLAIALRFYHAFEIPFTHDELSAYYRLQFDSFAELIEKGVKVDGHPALVQVFLYYWTAIFGFSEFMVKLPFLLLGVGSVPLIYSITKKWVNSSAALVVAAFLATLQFPIMFSQIARPYISGLFIILLLVKYWSQFLFEKENRKWSFVGMVLAASLASYNHYFSLLLAVIIGLSGFLFVSKQTIKQYALGLLIVLVLFIPHLPIFFYQLSLQGLDWLGKPGGDFFFEHLKFIFHFSYWVFSLVIGLFILGVYQSKSIRITKLQGVILSWFLLPIIIGMGYSIFVKPVIQYSMLLFSFPFLLVFLFSFIKPLKTPTKAFLICLIMVVNMSTLIWGREYYQVFYKQPFEQFSKITTQFKLGKYTPTPSPSAEVILDGDRRYISYYFKSIKPQIEFHSLTESLRNPMQFKAYIASLSNPYIILGNLPNQLVMIAKEYYPSLIYQEQGFTYSLSILGKKDAKSIAETPPIYYSTLTFETDNNTTGWSGFGAIKDPTNFVVQLDSTQEFGPSLDLDLGNVISSRHSLVEMILDFKSPQPPSGLIVCSITENGETISWNAVSLSEFSKPNDTNKWKRAYFSVDLTPVFRHSSQISGTQMKVNFWNKEKQNIMLDNFEVKIRKGNRYQYGTIEPID